MRIALIDKHQLLLRTLADTLKKHRPGTDVMIFTDLPSLLHQRHTQDIDIIITDMTVSELNGTDLIYNLKSSFPDSKLIVLSSITEIFSIRLAIRAGVDGYMSKYIPLHELLTAIDSIGNGEIYIEEALREKLVRHTLVEDKFLHKLSMREREVLKYICSGKTIKEIAHLLKLSPNTIQTYYRSMLRKFEMKKTSELIVFAIQNGLYIPEPV